MASTSSGSSIVDATPAPAPASNTIEEVISSVLRRRASGQWVSDTEVIEANRHLMPELQEQLEALAAIRRARLAAGRAAPVDSEIRVLSDQELEEPIRPDIEEPQVDPPTAAPPRVPGYSVLHLVSRGGQGSVYKAIHEMTGRVVAVKIMPEERLTTSTHRARFDREANILAALSHPNIVGIIDRGRTADGAFFTVMEFIDGWCLDDFLKEQLPAEEPTAGRTLELFAKIAEAIDEAHQRQIVHRDLKPSNVRVDSWGEPHVLDFGLARSAEGHDHPDGYTVTQPGQIVGSLPYSSPEQVSGAEVDVRSDVYSIGVMLYQAIAGRLPYVTDGSLRDTLNNIATSVPSPPTSARRLPQGLVDGRALDAIVLKALAKRPADRYESAGQLARDLRDYLAGRAVSASISYPARQSRRTILFAAIGCIALIGAALILGQVVHSDQPPTVFQLPRTSNSVGMQFVRIPAGSFMMGSPFTEEGRHGGERQRMASVSHAFYLSTTEVTQRQYERVMGANPADARWRGADLPVANVSWEQATEFCRRLSAVERRVYRLPDEVEWEYAARAGAQGPFGGSGRVDSMGWYHDNSGGKLHPVGQKYPNNWGLYDMHGGVAEWCRDAAPDDPVVTDSTPQNRAVLRIVRGGSALAPSDECRAAARQFLPRTTTLPDIGFRILLEPERP